MKLLLNKKYSPKRFVWDIVKSLLALSVILYGFYLRDVNGNAGIVTVLALPAMLYLVFKISDIYHMVTYK